MNGGGEWSQIKFTITTYFFLRRSRAAEESNTGIDHGSGVVEASPFFKPGSLIVFICIHMYHFSLVLFGFSKAKSISINVIGICLLFFFA
jgi:hypothetical protein